VRSIKQRLCTILRLEMLEDRTVLSAVLPGSDAPIMGPTVPAANFGHQIATTSSDPDAASDNANFAQSAYSSDPHRGGPAGGDSDASFASPGQVPLAHPENSDQAVWTRTAQDGDFRDDADARAYGPPRDSKPANDITPEDERSDADSATLLTGSPASHHEDNNAAPVSLQSPAGAAAVAPETGLPSERDSPECTFFKGVREVDTADALLPQETDADVADPSAVTAERRVEFHADHIQPQEADLLTSALPADTDAIDRAVQQFLAQFERGDLRQELESIHTGNRWAFWALGTTLTGLTALEFMGRSRQRDDRGLDRLSTMASGRSTSR
jgi:hypothetical protein